MKQPWRSARSTDGNLEGLRIVSGSREMLGRPLNLAGPVLTLASGRAGAIALQALVLGLQARALGVSNFGIVATATSFMFVFAGMSDFGFSVRALRLAAESGGGLARQMLLTRLVSLTLVSLPISLWAFAKEPPATTLTLVVVTALLITGETSGELCVTILLGRRQRMLASCALLVRRAAPVVPLLCALNYKGAVLSSVTGGVVGVGTAVALLLTLPRDKSPFWATITTSMTYWGTSLAGSIQRLDVVLVNALAGLEVAGLYGAATRLSNPLNAVTAVLLQIAVPEMSNATGEHRRKTYRYLLCVVALYASGLVILGLLARSATQLAFGAEYSNAWPITMAVCFSAAVSAFAQSRLAWAIAHKIPRHLPSRMLATTVLGLVAISAGSVISGTWGAAAGLLLLSCLVTSAVFRATSSSPEQV